MLEPTSEQLGYLRTIDVLMTVRYPGLSRFNFASHVVHGDGTTVTVANSYLVVCNKRVYIVGEHNFVMTFHIDDLVSWQQYQPIAHSNFVVEDGKIIES